MIDATTSPVNRAQAVGALIATAAVVLLATNVSPQTRAAPFVPVAVSLDAGRERAWATDLDAIRRLGFNSVTLRVAWRTAEPRAGEYGLAALDRRLADAARAQLRAIVRIDTDDAPEWLEGRFPDGRVLSARGTPVTANGKTRFCLDHPGVSAAALSFIKRVVMRTAALPAVYAYDFSPEPERSAAGSAAAVCYCAHTSNRFRAFLREAYGSLGALNAAWSRHLSAWEDVRPPAAETARTSVPTTDWQTFSTLRLEQHLQSKVGATAARGARLVFDQPRVPAVVAGAWPAAAADDWLMSRVVDRASAAIDPRPPGQPPWSPVQLGFALDGIRSAARDRGWWAGALPGDGRRRGGPSAAVTASDLRLWGWTAIARGARGLDYDLDGAGDAAVRAAGELADNFTRNAALFAPLQPRSSHVAIVFSRPSRRQAGPAARESMLGFYRAMFERNIQTDVVHPNEILAGYASEYALLFVPDGVTLPQPADAALRAYVANGGEVVRGLPEARSRGIMGNRDLSGDGALRPDVRIDRAHGLVEARVLESADAVVVVGLNHSDAPQTITLQFAPDMPEAIWQNMESGAAVNFVAGPEGPTYTHTFAPRDVVVLMIRKALR